MSDFRLVDLGPRRQLEVSAKPIDPLGPQVKLEMLLRGHPTGWRMFLRPRRARALAYALIEIADALPLDSAHLPYDEDSRR